jgi:hypothetical protein
VRRRAIEGISSTFAVTQMVLPLVQWAVRMGRRKRN